MFFHSLIQIRGRHRQVRHIHLVRLEDGITSVRIQMIIIMVRQILEQDRVRQVQIRIFHDSEVCFGISKFLPLNCECHVLF